MKTTNGTGVMIHYGAAPQRKHPATWIDDEFTAWLLERAPRSCEMPDSLAIDGRAAFVGAVKVQRLAFASYSVSVPFDLALEMFGVVTVLHLMHGVSTTESIPRCVESYMRSPAMVKGVNAN